MSLKKSIAKVLVMFQIASLIIMGAGDFLILGAVEKYKDKKVPVEKRIDDLIKRMTLEEKIDELCGLDFMDGKTNSRLGIPPLLMTDGPHGVRENYGKATLFPTLTGVGSTWDVDLVKEMGVALGKETRSKGRNLILGPCINIHRTPLGGRNFESFGEDPYLIGELAVAYVTGVQSEKIGTSTKHFAANNQEWERTNISVEIDERTLREIYLPGFEQAVKRAKTTTVMAAYNMVNGDYCCENSHLLKQILKKDWGFEGFVVSDWWAIHDSLKAAREGCDMEMPGPGNHLIKKVLLPAVREGKISEKEIDSKLRHILRVKYYLGLFDGVEGEYKGELNTEKHKELTLKLAEGSMILLKNNNGLLPLKKDAVKSIAVLGPNAKEANLGGGGSSQVSPFYAISALDGLKNKLGSSVKIEFEKGANMPGDLDEIKSEYLKPDKNSKENGLKAVYFDNPDFKGNPVLTRIDETVSFDWGENGPGAPLGRDNFSARWTGVLIPPISGVYELAIMSDDGSKLYLNNSLLVDNWGDHAAESKSSKISLKEGVEYNIKLEYYERGGGAVMKFGWVMPGSDIQNKAVELAKKSDVAIIFAGLTRATEGEGLDKRDLRLPGTQDDLIEAVADANKKTVVVLINGTPLEMGQWINKVDAVIEAWYPGQEQGTAIANVLFGDVSPSGKLTMTLPKKLEDNPSHGNYPGGNRKVHYREGIFVGYRHYDKNNIEPEFPFGHGLSYTTFEYSNMKITPKDSSSTDVTVTLDVKNTGKMEGKEVVQLYVSDIKASVPRPVRELKGFKKLNLKPGETKTVTFKLDKRSFAFYDTPRKDWKAESGEFEIQIGSSSRDIRVKDTFNLK